MCPVCCFTVDITHSYICTVDHILNVQVYVMFTILVLKNDKIFSWDFSYPNANCMETVRPT